MDRYPRIEPDSLEGDRRRVFDLIKQTRGSVRGPFAVWLECPLLAEACLRLQVLLNYETRLNKRLMQLMILYVARQMSAQFAWTVHARHAEQLGIEPEVVESIRNQREPSFAGAEDKLLYEVVRELCATGRLSDERFEKAVQSWGRDGLVELIAGIGFYQMVAMTLNAFDAQAPGGARPFD